MVHYFFSFLFFFFRFIGFYGLKWGLLGPAVNIFASQLLIYLVEMFVACLCLFGSIKGCSCFIGWRYRFRKDLIPLQKTTKKNQASIGYVNKYL